MFISYLCKSIKCCAGCLSRSEDQKKNYHLFTKSEQESKYFYLQNKNRPDIKKKEKK